MIPRYRAWDVLSEEMIDEILMISFVRKEIIGKLSNGFTSIPLKFEDERNGEDVVLMQSTGLFDKEGTEVFEGDILHHQIQTEYTFIVVKQHDNATIIYFRVPKVFGYEEEKVRVNLSYEETLKILNSY